MKKTLIFGVCLALVFSMVIVSVGLVSAYVNNCIPGSTGCSLTQCKAGDIYCSDKKNVMGDETLECLSVKDTCKFLSEPWGGCTYEDCPTMNNPGSALKDIVEDDSTFEVITITKEGTLIGNFIRNIFGDLMSLE